MTGDSCCASIDSYIRETGQRMASPFHVLCVRGVWSAVQAPHHRLDDKIDKHDDGAYSGHKAQALVELPAHCLLPLSERVIAQPSSGPLETSNVTHAVSLQSYNYYTHYTRKRQHFGKGI